jgi:choline kinase
VAECDGVVIVVGWQAEAVKEYVRSEYSGPLSLTFAMNENFNLQNGLSVLCARPYVRDGFLLTMADHILDDEIMRSAKNHQPVEGGATLAVDYKIDSIFDLDDATKVYAEGNRIREIGKTLEVYNCIDTGVFIGTDGLMAAIAAVYREKGDASLSEGVQLLADSGKMGILDIKDAFWQDVDTPEMLAHAQKYLSSTECK